MDRAPGTTPLSERLREGTRADHREAESQPFIEHLLAGSLTRDAYADLAAQQWEVYRALESASARMRDDDRGGPLVFDEAARVPAIERDLAFLRGPGWRTEVRIFPATRTYATRLHEVGQHLPEYTAHAYTRYLGDLSGGQVVRRMLEKHYGLSGDGLAFYDFPGIGRTKPFKDLYRDRMDALSLNDDEADACVAEARHAFTLNRDVFAELAQVHC